MLGRLFGMASGDRREGRDISADEALAALSAQRSGSGGRAFPVNSSNAMVHDAVYGSIRSISNPIMIAPVATYSGDALSAKATPSSLLPTPQVIADPASDWEIDREGFMSFLVDSLLLWGNLFGEITRLDRSGWPEAIRPVHPGEVEWRRQRSGHIDWFLNGQPIKRYPKGPLWHRALYPSGSPVGIPPIYWGASQISLGLAAQEAASDWFRHGSHPSGVLSSDRPVSNDGDKVAAERAKERVQAAARNREIVVVGNGYKFQPIQIPPDQAQFLETAGANVATIARLFGVDPRRIGGSPQGGQSLTYSNLEMSELAHMTIAVNPVAHVVHGALSSLIPDAQYIRLRLDDEAVLGAMVEMQLASLGMRSGLLTHGEGRGRLGLDPIPGREDDDHVWPPMSNHTLVLSAIDEEGAVADELIDRKGQTSLDWVPDPVPSTNGNH